MNELITIFMEFQQNLNSMIALNLREVSQNNSLELNLIILGIAFIYGVIHAIGPGHGKLLVSSYFLSNGKDYKKAFKLGYMISIVHTISALTITLVTFFILKTMLSKTFNETSAIITKISGFLILGIAIYLIYETFFQKEQEEKVSEKDIKKKEIVLAISAGIIPCPGVMTIVLFSIMVSKLYIGVLSAILMSIGMGFTISLSAILATKIKQVTNKKHNNITKILHIFSIIMISCLGIYLISK